MAQNQEHVAIEQSENIEVSGNENPRVARRGLKRRRDGVSNVDPRSSFPRSASRETLAEIQHNNPSPRTDTGANSKVPRHTKKLTGIVYAGNIVEDPAHLGCGIPDPIIRRCKELGLLETERVTRLPTRVASVRELTSVHSVDHVQMLTAICSSTTESEFELFERNYEATSFDPNTDRQARLTCGGIIDLMKSVAAGYYRNGMAILNPPGHNAMKEEYSGNCYFNNVAVAAKQVLEAGWAKKILIVDFDLHHGQGTQQAFYDDPRVLYFSIHRYEYGKYWPHLEESNYNWIGAGKGVGFNCNVPINQVGMGNAEFLTVWHQILIPLAYKFDPDLVVVSAGYDAMTSCPKGEMKMLPQCYPHLIRPLMAFADGRLVVVLEGVSCPTTAADGVALTLRTLLGDPCPVISPISTPLEEIVSAILNIQTMLQKKWKLGMPPFLETDKFQRELKNGNAHVHVPELRFDRDVPNREFIRAAGSHHSNCYTPTLDLTNPVDPFHLNASLAVAKHRVGLIYDVIMLQHLNQFDTEHPEKPERASRIFDCHVANGLLQRCLRINTRKATDEELRLLHTEKHIQDMRNTSTMSTADLKQLEKQFRAVSIYFHESTFEAALYSTGSVLQAVDSVLTGECQSVVAIVRPPGHHAEEKRPCGFCIFNNVALAAKYAIDTHNLSRVMILDWDVHHGNGIQHLFEEDPKVLYISIHRYDRGDFFPGSLDANFDAVGRGPGKGFNVNIPWNGIKMGDTEYLTAFTSVILPIAYEFGPELVLVSAGFDAAQGDPMGEYQVTPAGYAHMTNFLMPLANGKIIMALEGGYNLDATAQSMAFCTKTLLGDPLPRISLKKGMAKSASNTIRDVLRTHSKYWSVLEPFEKMLPAKCPIPFGLYPTEKVDSKSSHAPAAAARQIAGQENQPACLKRRTRRCIQRRSPAGLEMVPGLPSMDHNYAIAHAGEQPVRVIDLGQENRPETPSIVEEEEWVSLPPHPGYEPPVYEEEWVSLPPHPGYESPVYEEEWASLPPHPGYESPVYEEEWVSLPPHPGYQPPEYEEESWLQALVRSDPIAFAGFLPPVLSHSPEPPVPNFELEEIIDLTQDSDLSDEDFSETVVPDSTEEDEVRNHNTEQNETVQIFPSTSTAAAVNIFNSAAANIVEALPVGSEFVQKANYSVASGLVKEKRASRGKRRPLHYYCGMDTCRQDRKMFRTLKDLIACHYDKYHNAEKPRRCAGCDQFFSKQEAFLEHNCDLPVFCDQLTNLHVAPSKFFA